MSNPSSLLLLADHIKLSLLERQRAISLDLDTDPSQESNISRSLESLHDGLEALSQKSPDDEILEDLRSQYKDLSRQFHGESTSTTAETLTKPNDPKLKDDFQHAQSGAGGNKTATGRGHNVRFKDDPEDDAEDEANRAALFQEQYRDDDRAKTPDPTESMDNQQIHEYHDQVMREQDDQLDRLGESIGRQRFLGLEISNELEGQIALLDDVEQGVDRHQSRLDQARGKLDRFSRKVSQNWGTFTIGFLVLILVLLIVVLK